MTSLPIQGLGGLFLSAALALTSAIGPAQASPLTPDAAVHAALTAPAAYEAEAASAVARALQRQSALLLNNPNLNASLLGGDRLEASLLQPLSLGGESVASRRLADHTLESAEATERRTRLQLAAAARLAYTDAVVTEQQLAIAASGAALAERLTAAVQRKYEEGEAARLELRLAHMAEAQVSARLLDARVAQVEALRALSLLTGLIIDSDALMHDPLSSAPAIGEPTTAERSDVAAARAALAAAQAERSRQRAASLPTLSVGAAMERDADVGAAFGPAIAVSLPLFDRNQSGRAAAEGSVAVAESWLARVEATAETERRSASARQQEAERLLDHLGETLVAEGAAALESVNSGYAAGESDLVTTVLLQAEILDGQTAAVALTGRVAAARIDLLLATDDSALLPAVVSGGGQ